jgi:hypothetical protein
MSTDGYLYGSRRWPLFVALLGFRLSERNHQIVELMDAEQNERSCLQRQLSTG